MMHAVSRLFNKRTSSQLVVMVVALTLIMFSLAACNGTDQEQKGGQQAQQESAQQQEEVTQPSLSNSAVSNPGANSGRGLIGTWEATESDLGPGLGGGMLTFSDDGTFQAQPLPADAPDLILSGEYSVDDSHITFIDPEGGESQTEYILEGDTLTTHVQVEDPEFPIDTKATYQRKS
jgi:hypothetical protein